MSRRHTLHVSEVQFFPAEPTSPSVGFLGHTSFVLDRIVRLDSISVRRSLQGVTYLSYPRRRDRAGREHFYSAPFDDEIRREIDRQVLSQLRLLEGNPMSPVPLDMHVDRISFEPAFPNLADEVVGWASATVNDRYRIRELPIGRASDRRFVVLCWPKDSFSPRTRRFVFGLDLDARREIERQLIAALPIERGIPR